MAQEGGEGTTKAPAPAPAPATPPAHPTKEAPPAKAPPAPAADKPAPKAAHAPRRAQRARRHRRAIPPDAAIATYPGFRVLPDGSSHVFVEVSKKIEVVEQKSGARVVYVLKGAVSPSRNNLLPLMTGFFRSPVDRVQLVEQGDDLALVVTLREATPVEHTLRESEGGVLLDVKVAPSKAPADTARADAVVPASTKRSTDTTRIGRE